MATQLKFKISPDGEISLGVEGAVGRECETFSKPFEQRLGSIAKRDYKDAYYQENNQEEGLRQNIDSENESDPQ
jgi:hypothetical protein